MFSRFDKDCDVLVRWDADTRMYIIYIRNTPDSLPYECEEMSLFTAKGCCLLPENP